MRLDGITGRGLAVLLAGSLVSACASTGAVPRPFPAPGGTPAGPAPEGYALTSTALALRGAPYRNGGVSPEGFDCSGFVQYVFGQHGVALPRETRDQFRTGQRVDRGQLEPGDLVFFTTVAPGASHVGIMIGGDQFVHAPSERGVVRVERLSSSYWNRRFVGGRRPR
ncbi:MAG: C40 family peptidase [Acidobacteria bacterium]|nr:C40 family peptidase [Acidobacteriota bacterium]